MTAVAQPRTERLVFERPMSRVIVDLLGAPFGAVMFLGWAVLLASGVILPRGLDLFSILMWRVLAPVGFGFFGLLMASGVPMSFRRGLRRAVLEVGPDGLWTPEMGRLAWIQIADVRLEKARAFAGEQGITTYRRIGIVPVDPERTHRERRRLAWRLTEGYLALVRRMRPSASASLPDLERMAPFGVYDYEVGGSLAAAVLAISAYRSVGGTTPGA